MKRLVEPEVNIADLEFVDPGTAAAQRWHRRIARSGILRVAVAVVAVLGVLAYVHGRLDTRWRRARLIREAEAERAAHPAAVQLIDLLDRATVELAREPFAGPLSGPLDVRGPGIYLRALQDEVSTPRSVHTATIASRKDSFLACLLQPPADLSHAAIHQAAIKYRWRVDLESVAVHVRDADILDAGLRVASRSWIEEVQAAVEPTSLRMLDHERAGRTPGMLRRAVALADARFVAVVIDELPTGSAVASAGLAEVLKGSRLDEVTRVPHMVRAAVVDVPSGRVVIRVRTEVDASDIHVPNAMADAEELHGCQAALAVRAAAR